MNEKCCKLLKQVINKLYDNIRLDSMSYNEDEFYYEFKSDIKISENDFNKLEEEIKKIDNSVFVKLLRISGVYYNRDANNEMIDRIVGKAFDSEEEYDKYLKFLEEVAERDHRKIGADLDLFCFSDYAHVSEIMQYLFFWVWFISLSIRVIKAE